MTIEFETPYGKISEKLVGFLRTELIGLSHTFKNITKAEVKLKEDENIIPSENKICKIKLNVVGDNLIAYARAENFAKAARDAIKDLNRKIKNHKASVAELNTSVLA